MLLQFTRTFISLSRWKPIIFAAWPMLVACFTLYYLRDWDTQWSWSDSAENQNRI